MNGGSSEGGLPLSLAQTLSPALRTALDNPIRRDILRTLQAAQVPKSLSEIAADLVVFGIPTLDYHLTVLAGSGEVTQADIPGRYVSTVSDDPQVRAVLRATMRRDQEDRTTSARNSSSSRLKMFPVPRPTISIRLGRRRRGKT